MTELREHWSRDVLRFWFHELKPDAWFRVDPELDETIRQRFMALHQRLRGIPPKQLLVSARSALAAIIVFDQFSRNMFRGTPEAFAADPRALALAERSLEAGFDRELGEAERRFLYMPFMHAEDRAAQQRCVALFGELKDSESLDYASGHKEIIDRFSRFPHRNAILNRSSTPEEQEFLKTAPEF